MYVSPLELWRHYPTHIRDGPGAPPPLPFSTRFFSTGSSLSHCRGDPLGQQLSQSAAESSNVFRALMSFVGFFNEWRLSWQTR
jgi:hypothetical protein